MARDEPMLLHRFEAKGLSRGGARPQGTPKTYGILHKYGKWYAYVTTACVPACNHGHDVVALDWGVESFATINGESTFPGDLFCLDGAYHPASGTVRAVERGLYGSSAKQDLLRSVRMDVERFKQELRT